jgi:hypothetical protein
LILAALILSAAYLEDNVVVFELVASVSLIVSMMNGLMKESEIQNGNTSNQKILQCGRREY